MSSNSSQNRPIANIARAESAAAEVSRKGPDDIKNQAIRYRIDSEERYKELVELWVGKGYPDCKDRHKRSEYCEGKMSSLAVRRLPEDQICNYRLNATHDWHPMVKEGFMGDKCGRASSDIKGSKGLWLVCMNSKRYACEADTLEGLRVCNLCAANAPELKAALWMVSVEDAEAGVGIWKVKKFTGLINVTTKADSDLTSQST
ncbi:hypothetical protein BJ508DRAFT_9580 [Ascobolus immersus RN42]|uniref:Uncharacterized protein n=1 Tax=Ascobolus immersus RN42 TaxID=1160509 RepID=A0A3N4HR82_ASCIM|nr:hypothetical protein BJ508DRAFT_9580 [Ascobolus immersus RN42]